MWGAFTDPPGGAAGWPRQTMSLTLLVAHGKVPCADGKLVYVRGRGASLAPAAMCIPIGSAAFLVDAVDASSLPQQTIDALLDTPHCEWRPCRSLLGHGEPGEIEAVARAVSLLSWHRENLYSGLNGERTEAVEGGRRRAQPASAGGRTIYPRVDPVAICLVVSADGERCLLGRQKNYPSGMWTCISGFVEHGESVEAAAMREVAEETAVVCAAAALVASQPWPLGRGLHCELMLACVATAAPEGEAIDVTQGGAPGELEAARWFTRAEVQEMARRSAADDGPWLPPPFAIAHHLIDRWAKGLLAPTLASLS
ncbi:hypothetical protein AB1Y20_016009 [Prymnesium parvum]|uniref:NAD(+) diphosphatase n=1 Tax=Prymnesium parvum TaxID=97485 RepID=A0AB34JYB7_PRYPA